MEVKVGGVAVSEYVEEKDPLSIVKVREPRTTVVAALNAGTLSPVPLVAVT